MLLEQLARGGDGDTDEPLIEGDVPDVFAHQGHIGDFDYIEAILGEVDSIDEELPLVVLLHGRGGRPSIPHRGMAGEPAVRLFIPRAPDRLGDHGFTWLATWTTSGNTELLARSLAGRVDELMPAIEAFIALRPTRGKPVVAGFSQGAIMTYGLVTRYPQKFAAGFPIAGWLPEQMLPEAPQADVTYPLIRAMHGTADETVPFDFGRQTYQSLRGLGYPVEWTEVPGVAHETTPEMGQQVRGWIGQVLFPEAQPQTVTQDTP
jgi:phospholipase/carboxylesterase